MPTKTDKSIARAWTRRFNARFFYGPMIDQAVRDLYRWARRKKMPTGARYPGLRMSSALAGELASNDRSADRPCDPLPAVVIEDHVPLTAPPVEAEGLQQVLERELGEAERRRDPRIPFRRLVRYSDGETFATGEILNISATGLLIRASVLLPAGAMVAGAFQPDEDGQGQPVGFKGRVARQFEDSEGRGMGIEFTRMIEAHEQEVERIVETKTQRRDPTLRGWKASG